MNGPQYCVCMAGQICHSHTCHFPLSNETHSKTEEEDLNGRLIVDRAVMRYFPQRKELVLNAAKEEESHRLKRISHASGVTLGLKSVVVLGRGAMSVMMSEHHGTCG